MKVKSLEKTIAEIGFRTGLLDANLRIKWEYKKPLNMCDIVNWATEFVQTNENRDWSLSSDYDTELGEFVLKQVLEYYEYGLTGDNCIEIMGLSTRSYNGLKRAGFNTIGDIAKKYPKDIKNVRNLGPQSYEEIVEKLSNCGFSLRNPW